METTGCHRVNTDEPSGLVLYAISNLSPARTYHSPCRGITRNNSDFGEEFRYLAEKQPIARLVTRRNLSFRLGRCETEIACATKSRSCLASSFLPSFPVHPAKACARRFSGRLPCPTRLVPEYGCWSQRKPDETRRASAEVQFDKGLSRSPASSLQKTVPPMVPTGPRRIRRISFTEDVFHQIMDTGGMP